eukprot:1713430-Amphidinium_carterae.2
MDMSGLDGCQHPEYPFEAWRRGQCACAQGHAQRLEVSMTPAKMWHSSATPRLIFSELLNSFVSHNGCSGEAHHN